MCLLQDFRVYIRGEPPSAFRFSALAPNLAPSFFRFLVGVAAPHGGGGDLDHVPRRGFALDRAAIGRQPWEVETRDQTIKCVAEVTLYPGTVGEQVFSPPTRV